MNGLDWRINRYLSCDVFEDFLLEAQYRDTAAAVKRTNRPVSDNK